MLAPVAADAAVTCIIENDGAEQDQPSEEHVDDIEAAACQLPLRGPIVVIHEPH